MPRPKRADSVSDADIEALLADPRLSEREVARRLGVSRRRVGLIKKEHGARSGKKPPKYQLHRASGRAFIEVRGRREYLGVYESPESRQRYYARLAELASVGKLDADSQLEAIATAADTAPAAEGMIVDALLWRVWQWAEERYRNADGATAHLENLRQAVKRLTARFGRIAIEDFGPSHVKAFRDDLVSKGAARSYVNKLTGYIKQIFTWGMEEEIVPELVAFRVIKTKNLKAGRSAARETAPVEPVADVWVDATLPHLSPAVRAMVELQRLTGIRSSNVCEMRASEIEMRGEVWIYTPRRHKTQHLGHRLRIPLGPRAQSIIRPYLRPNLEAYLFSPRESAEAYWAAKSAARKTKRPPSQMARRRKAAPKRSARECYDARSYCRAISRGVEKANRSIRRTLHRELSARPGAGYWLLYSNEMARELAIRLVPHWHPHQLRHARSTEVRQRFGLDAAQVALSHRDRRTTERYAKVDDTEALRIAAETG